MDREAWNRIVRQVRGHNEKQCQGKKNLCLYYCIILLHRFGFSINVKRFTDTLYTQPLRTVQTWHCSRITACIGIRTGVVTLRGLREDAVRPTGRCLHDRMFGLQWTGKGAQRIGRGLTKVLSRNLPGRTEAEYRSTARTTGIRARFEAGTTGIQVYSVTATLTYSETRQKYLNGLVTWSSVLTFLMKWNRTLNRTLCWPLSTRSSTLFYPAKWKSVFRLRFSSK